MVSAPLVGSEIPVLATQKAALVQRIDALGRDKWVACSFGTPRQLTDAERDDVKRRFEAAKRAAEAHRSARVDR